MCGWGPEAEVVMVKGRGGEAQGDCLQVGAMSPSPCPLLLLTPALANR